MSLPEDSDAIFTVELNRENQSVEWYKDGVQIKNEPKRRIFSSEKQYILRINEVNSKDHKGKYSLKVKDLLTSCQLSIIGKKNPVL